ncbi:MAG TPA: peptidylprolyl isomerase [Coleofasciculaceae cyanobacterium]|jgi:parvulin-like peptidyl-prolyl isomerase
MVSHPFLSVDDQPISLKQALQYLQAGGKLQSFIGDILRQHVIEQELQNREDLDVSPLLTEQAVIDFRLNNQLSDPKVFADWLASNGNDYSSFLASITFGFKLEKLKVQVTEPKLQEYFIERKLFLDRVVLSRIIVAQAELAEELTSQIEEGVNFEQLVREYSIAEDKIVNGMMGPVSRGTLPDVLRAAVDSASPGELIGPLELEGHWVLFRFEQFLPASIEDRQLKQALQNELFEQWLAQKIQNMNVKIQVG